jgi:hypothetical protein
MVAGVQDVVLDLALLQQLRQQFRFLDRGGTDEIGLAAFLALCRSASVIASNFSSKLR